MTELFGSTYVEAYDLLYHDKDYGAECDLIERIFETFGEGPIRRIFDMGCGTGNHAIPLAQRGYDVVGVDRSETMLAHARRKTANVPSDGRLVVREGDIRTIDLQEQFDAALMMFAVLGYQRENSDVLSAISNARRHLRPGGLFLFDVWYGPAVLRQRPSQRIKVVPIPGGHTLRAASGELNTGRHLCTVHFHVWRLEGGRLVAETEESHSVRYFFPLEMNFLLEASQFAPLRVGAFPEFDKEPDETTWNVLAVARAS